MTKATQYGTVKDGVLKIINIKRFKDDLRQFDDCEVEVIIKKRGKRSSQANRYYWGIVIDEIRRELLRRGERFTPEEVHEGLKARFNPKSVGDKETGEEIFSAGDSTTEMNKEEFGLYLERIIEWCNTKLEIIIPEAGEQTSFFDKAA
jgi:hypothetical protein